MSEPLRLVDPATGLLHEKPKTAQELEDTVVGLQHTIRSQAATIGRLKADLQPEEGHDLFPVAKRLHDYWRDRCKHPRSKFNVDRFKELLPRLKEHDEAMCRRAIDGAAFDAYETTRKNGTVKRHDGWELIFRVDKFEEFANRAPYHLPKPEDLAIVSKAILWRHPDWDWERVTYEAKPRVRRWAT